MCYLEYCAETQHNSVIVPPISCPVKSPLSLLPYRPVALVSCISKLMEKSIPFRREWFLQKEETYPDITSGFRDECSSIDGVINLIRSIEPFKTCRRVSAAVFLHINGALNSINITKSYTP